MLLNLLADATKTRTVSIGESALYALLGFLVVFVGITLLIFVVWLVGKIINKVSNVQSNLKNEKAAEVQKPNTAIAMDSEEISEETVAAITAAIMAYYQEQQSKCEFTVKRIKKV
ncbi:MAG: hypothetical protein E7355_00245 [Clostridiales bacterium]|nr:hypothetical protein [Clostridiales bacterium]